MSEVEIVSGYLPGALGRIVSLHGTYYHANWGFDSFFDAKVSTEFGSFLREYDPTRDGVWLALSDGRVQGSIVIDGSTGFSDGAHLRWFIVADELKGRGAGGRLLRAALGFCREKAYPKVYLNTFAGLDEARRLYEAAGFQLVEQHPGSQWGTEVLEQRFECHLGADAGDG